MKAPKTTHEPDLFEDTLAKIFSDCHVTVVDGDMPHPVVVYRTGPLSDSVERTFHRAFEKYRKEHISPDGEVGGTSNPLSSPDEGWDYLFAVLRDEYLAPVGLGIVDIGSDKAGEYYRLFDC